MAGARIYQKLPNNIISEAIGSNIKKQDTWNYSADDFFKGIIKRNEYGSDVHKQYFSLEKWPRIPKTSKNKLKRHLTYKEKRKIDITKIKDGNLKYEHFLPMHNLWRSYIESILNLKKGSKSNPDEMRSLLLKADYHGCIVVVSRAKNPALIGLSGIIIRETKNCFLCITRENKIKTVPKQNSVFNYQVGHHLFTLYGNHFRVKTTDRKAQKFKSKPTIEL